MCISGPQRKQIRSSGFLTQVLFLSVLSYRLPVALYVGIFRIMPSICFIDAYMHDRPPTLTNQKLVFVSRKYCFLVFFVPFSCRPLRRALSYMVPNKQHPTYKKDMFATLVPNKQIRPTKKICLRHCQDLSNMVRKKQHPTYNKYMFATFPSSTHASQFRKKQHPTYRKHMFVTLTRSTDKSRFLVLLHAEGSLRSAFFFTQVPCLEVFRAVFLSPYVGLFRTWCQTNNIRHTKKICLRHWCQTNKSALQKRYVCDIAKIYRTWCERNNIRHTTNICLRHFQALRTLLSSERSSIRHTENICL